MAGKNGKNGKFRKLLKGDSLYLGTEDYRYFRQKDKEMEREAIRSIMNSRLSA